MYESKLGVLYVSGLLTYLNGVLGSTAYLVQFYPYYIISILAILLFCWLFVSCKIGTRML